MIKLPSRVSPSKKDKPAAPINNNVKKLLNCSKNLTKIDFFFCSVMTFKPYFVRN